LQRLHQVGVVDLHPNRGAFVAKPSVRRARETFDARIILESGIFRRVAGCVQAKDLKLLREVIELEERALDSGDRNALIRYTGEFHITLCNVLGNEELNRMLRELVSRTSVALAVFPPSGFVSADSKHHRKIVACLEKRDGEGAVETLVTTLKEVQRSLDFEFATKKKDELREIVSQMMERNQ
ncbi:MAG: GntR family transcriptional regulator, partial [Parvibaculaceae bacterium]